MTINIIVAMDKNQGIGLNNKLPWHLPADLRYFKRVTEHNIIVMGRKTWESIGCKPLPNRSNVVLTRDGLMKDYKKYRDCATLSSADIVINTINDEEKEIFIIGGNSVYTQFLPYADNLFITEINHEFEVDSYFPEYDKSEWRLIGEQKGIKDEKNPYDYSFKIYTRQMKE
jgi:dihydrofolate reductase